MAINDSYAYAVAGVADSSALVADGSNTETGAAQVVELGGTAAADIIREVDADGDGTFGVAITIDQLSGEWHSQDNHLRITQSKNSRIRVVNTSGGAADYYVAGYEVDN